MEEEEETNREIWIDKPIWDEESIKRYQEKLEEELEIKEDKIGWSELKEIIRKSMVTKRIKINRKVRRDEEWYDRECRTKKRELRRQLRKLKRGKIEGKEYTDKRREYKEMVKKKKEKWGEELLARLNKIREGKEFWEEVNKRRKRRETISKRIEAETWEKHFRGLLDGKKTKKKQRMGGS